MTKKPVLSKKDKRGNLSRRLNRIDLTLKVLDNVVSDSEAESNFIQYLFNELFYLSMTLNNDLRNKYGHLRFNNDLSDSDIRFKYIQQLNVDFENLKDCFIRGDY